MSALSVKQAAANQHQQNATKPWLFGVLPQGKSGTMPELSV